MQVKDDNGLKGLTSEMEKWNKLYMQKEGLEKVKN